MSLIGLKLVTSLVLTNRPVVRRGLKNDDPFNYLHTKLIDLISDKKQKQDFLL